MIRRITQKVGLRRRSSASQNPERIVALQQMNDKRDPSGDPPIPGSVEENTEFFETKTLESYGGNENNFVFHVTRRTIKKCCFAFCDQEM